MLPARPPEEFGQPPQRVEMSLDAAGKSACATSHYASVDTCIPSLQGIWQLRA
jgi:hypothetical protein